MNQIDSKNKVWRSADYRWWFTGDSAAALGGGLRNFATPLLAIATTGSATAAGFISSAVSFALVIGIFYGGLAADKLNKKFVMLRVSLVCVIAYALIAGLSLFGTLNGWLLTVLLVVGVLAYGLTSPVSDATLRSIVPTNLYPQALAINDGRNSVLEIAGSPIGGFLYSVAPGWPFMAAAFGTAVNGFSFLRIKANLDPHTQATESSEDKDDQPMTARKKVWAHLKEANAGVTFIFHNAIIRVLAVGSLLLNVGFSGIFQTIIFTWYDDGRSALIIGLLSASLAVGTIVGALFTGKLTRRFATGTLLMCAFLWAAITLSALVVFHTPWQVIVILALTGLVLPLANAAGLGFMVTAAGEEKQGRVISAQTMLGMAATPLALIFAGFSYDQFGAQTTLAIMSVPLAIAVVYIASNRKLRTVPRADQWDDFLSNNNQL